MNIPSTTLNNGVEMPLLGLGVYTPSQNDEVQSAIEWALEAGCRLIDTAAAYGNEREVADAIRSSGIPRSDIFITTKVMKIRGITGQYAHSTAVWSAWELMWWICI